MHAPVNRADLRFEGALHVMVMGSSPRQFVTDGRCWSVMHASADRTTSLADLSLGAESRTIGVRGSPIEAKFTWRPSQGAFGPLFERASSCPRIFFPVPTHVAMSRQLTRSRTIPAVPEVKPGGRRFQTSRSGSKPVAK